MSQPFVLALAMLMAGFAGRGQAHDGPGRPMQRQAIAVPAADFSLTSQDGRVIRLSDLRGRPILLTFIYTSCPDACPLVTADMVRIQKLMKARGGPDVLFLSITTDPDVDRPEILKVYAERHGVDLASWYLLTGSLAELQPVWRAYSVQVTPRARGLVDHSGVTLLIDRLGRIRYRYRGWSLDTPTVVADLERLSARHRR
jgi:protein SCO1/2